MKQQFDGNTVLEAPIAAPYDPIPQDIAPAQSDEEVSDSTGLTLDESRFPYDHAQLP